MLKTMRSRVLKAAFWGAGAGAVFGITTLAIDYGNHYFGPKSGHGGWGMLFTILVSLPVEYFLQATGAKEAAFFHAIYGAIGGYWIAAIFNAVIGAVTVGAFAFIVSDKNNQSQQNEPASHSTGR